MEQTHRRRASARAVRWALRLGVVVGASLLLGSPSGAGRTRYGVAYIPEPCSHWNQLVLEFDGRALPVVAQNCVWGPMDKIEAARLICVAPDGTRWSSGPPIKREMEWLSTTDCVGLVQ